MFLYYYDLSIKSFFFVLKARSFSRTVLTVNKKIAEVSTIKNVNYKNKTYI